MPFQKRNSVESYPNKVGRHTGTCLWIVLWILRLIAGHDHGRVQPTNVLNQDGVVDGVLGISQYP